MGPWKSLTGMVQLRLTSADLPSALRAVSAAGICVHHTEAEGDLSLRLWVSRRDWGRLEALAGRRGERLELLCRRGVYWKGKALLHRPVLLAGMVMLLILALYLPEHIFFIQVEGNKRIPERQILEAAEKSGICFGSSRRAVRSERMKNQLLSAIPELEWAGVNTSGCVATISVCERAEPEEPPEEKAIGGIIASRDGVIVGCTVLSGNALCHVGQAVQKGQLLVSGYTDCGYCIQAAPASAEIFGDTRRELTVLLPSVRQRRTGQTGNQTRYSLILGKKRINLCRDSGIPEGTCGKMSYIQSLTLPGGFVLPVSLEKEVYAWYETEEAFLSESAAETLLTAFARDYLTGSMIAGEILSQDQTMEERTGTWCLKGIYACRELIGQAIQWETLENYGENG